MPQLPIEMIVLAAIAVLLLFRLKSVLGTRTGFEEPIDQNAPPQFDTYESTNIIPMPGIEPDRSEIKSIADLDSEFGKTLIKIQDAQPGFSFTEFMGGARAAHEMILMAYENGEKDTLKPFLDNDVYSAFESVIDDREKNNLTVQANYIGVRSAKIVDAIFDENTNEAELHVAYSAEITSVVKDSDGAIIEGDPKEIKRINDTWAYTRVLGSDDPNWILVATGL